MNIVYHQHGNFVFLKEGLSKLWHNIFDIQFKEKEQFDKQIESVCKNPDIIFFEFYGPFKLPSGIEESKYLKVAYCIDSSVYEFLLIHTMKLFDYVFVDQKSTVNEFEKYGTKSIWLPLCVPEENFRVGSKKEYDICFVGGLSNDRIKRINMLNYIKKYYRIKYEYGISVNEMQNLFASSKIVLNENHLNGVNLRVFQALASGSLLFTERDSYGLNALFEDEKHLVTYTRDTLIDQIDKYINDDNSAIIANNGNIECRNNHTSYSRALQCIKIIENKEKYNIQRDREEQILAQAEVLYIRALRFGGSLKWSIELTKKGIALCGKHLGQFYSLYGSILYTIGKKDDAKKYIFNGYKNGYKLISLVKLAVIEIINSNYNDAKNIIYAIVDDNKYKYIQEILNCNDKYTIETKLFYTLSRILFEYGNIHFIGFSSQLDIQRYIPFTAAELAYIAWKIDYNPIILDFLINCYRFMNISLELLSLLNIANDKGLLTQRQLKLYKKLLYESYYI